MKEKDFFRELPIINECMIIGGGIGRPPKPKQEHIDTMCKLIIRYAEDIRDSCNTKPPTIKQMRYLVKASEMIGRARGLYFKEEEDQDESD